MGDVKRYYVCVNCQCGRDTHEEISPDGAHVDYADYARLERERDESRRAFERAEADVQVLVRERDEAVSVADSMGRDAVEFSAKLAEAAAELTRLRAVVLMAARIEPVSNHYDNYPSTVDCPACGASTHLPWHSGSPDMKVAIEDLAHHEDCPAQAGRALAEACGRKG